MSKTNKFVLWCVLVAITSFWMWAGVQNWLKGSLYDFSNIGNFIILGGLFAALLVLLSLGFVLFQNRIWSIYFGLIVGVIYSLLLGVSEINLVGIFILVMLFYHAQDIIIGEVKERIKMNSRLLLKKGMVNVVVSFFILVSFAAYQSPAIEEFKNINKLPSSSEIFIKTVVEQMLNSQLGEISPQQKEQIFNQTTQEVVREFNLWLEPYFQYAPPALAFGFFVILWGVGWIFVWLAVLLGIIMFWGLKKTKFFRIEEKDIKAETILI